MLPVVPFFPFTTRRRFSAAQPHEPLPADTTPSSNSTRASSTSSSPRTSPRVSLRLSICSLVRLCISLSIHCAICLLVLSVIQSINQSFFLSLFLSLILSSILAFILSFSHLLYLFVVLPFVLLTIPFPSRPFVPHCISQRNPLTSLLPSLPTVMPLLIPLKCRRGRRLGCRGRKPSCSPPPRVL